MTVRITPFSATNAGAPRYQGGGPIRILGAQSGNRQDLTGSGEKHTTDYAVDTIVGINVTADCYIRIGVDAEADATTAEPWPSGTTDFRFVRTGERVSTFS